MVQVDGNPVRVSPKYLAVVVLNIPSYAGTFPNDPLELIQWGGTDLWGTDKKESIQTVSDHKFEVVGIRGVSHMGLMQAKATRGHHICQVSAFALVPIDILGI